MKQHKLKVYEAPGFTNANVPVIRLQGKWLEQAGFHMGEPFLVEVNDGELRIILLSKASSSNETITDN